jgi:hypothetical protein
MFIFTTWALRCSGLSGIIGSLFFICGDLLYNHVPGSSASPAAKMGKLPTSRLIHAGTLGLFGCWFYVLAAWHLYLAFRPAGEVFAFILLLAFGAVMICYGISHTAYFSIAAGAHVAADNGTDLETGGHLGNAFFQRLVTTTYVPVGISSLMMLYGIVTGRSLYPRWMVIFLPVIVYLLKTPLVRILKGRLRELVNDSYDNIVLFVFYLISTLVLWNGGVIYK